MEDEVVLGLAGNDSLHGGYGNDTLDGGPGKDTAILTNGNDVIEIKEGQQSIGDYNFVLKNIECLFGERGNDTLRGNKKIRVKTTGNCINGGDGNDTITGSNGIDTLDGGKGIDKLAGGKGNDKYYVDHKNDQVIEADVAWHHGSLDTVYTSTNYKAPKYIETLVAIGDKNVELTSSGHTEINWQQQDNVPKIQPIQTIKIIHSQN